MSEQAATQLRRLLGVIPRLADGDAHPIAEVARSAGTTPAVLLKDLHTISERFGAEPAGFVEGLQIYNDGESVQLVSRDFRRPMGLTRPELWALELGLAILAGERPPDERAVLEHARERVRKAVAKVPKEEIGEDATRAAELPPVEPAHLAALRDSARTGRKARIAYRRGDADAPGERTICPYTLLVSRGAWYLVAYCERSTDIRVFRLDRVERVETLGEKFERPASYSPSDFVREGMVFRAEEAPTMTVRYSSRIARWIAEREGVEPDADGSVSIERPMADLDWGVRHVLQYGPDAEVVGPEALREAIVERLGRI
ncbi:MAG TPA: WYL domain-containing protein [Gemmatimonadaceae bacterium]